MPASGEFLVSVSTLFVHQLAPLGMGEKMRSRKLLVAAGLIAAASCMARPAGAAVLYSTGFSSPTYSDGPLNNPSPATDTTTPGQDGWLNTNAGGATTLNPISVSNSATNGIVSMATAGQDVRHPLSGAVTSGSVYMDADINVSAAQATGDYFLHLGDGGTSNFYARTYIKSSGTGYVMALGTSSGTAVTYGTTVLPFGQTQHVLVRYDFVAGAANDTGALFINPTTADGSSDTPYVAATNIGTDATNIAGVYLRQGAAGSSATLSSVDNIMVTGNVPEPASLGLAGAAGLLLVRRRRGA